jgi:hypothetical protein
LTSGNETPEGRETYAMSKDIDTTVLLAGTELMDKRSWRAMQLIEASR